MKLEKIIVKGLFGVFNHEIVLKEHITILVSENGYGKTMILRMLEALFEYNIVFFHTVIFEEFILEFEGYQGLFPESKYLILKKDANKNIYLNGKLILNNDDYETEMRITIKNASTEEERPTDIPIIDLIQSPYFNRFDRFKAQYNHDEIESVISKLSLPRINTHIINTDRVDGFFSPRRFTNHYIKARQDANNDYFIQILNSFLAHKKIQIQDGKFMILSTLTNKIIPIINLSSGEKHLFALFYELIFRTFDSSFVLLDEPEISLHISWQNKFIRTLQEIVAFKPLNILIATHSPNIIDSHWKIVIELNEPINL